MAKTKEIGNITLKGKDIIERFDNLRKQDNELIKDIEDTCREWNPCNRAPNRNGGDLRREIAVKLAMSRFRKSFYLLNNDDINKIYNIRSSWVFS